jgi:hypothetical protein
MTSNLWRTVAGVAVLALLAAALGPSVARAASPKKPAAPVAPQVSGSTGMKVAVGDRGNYRKPTLEEAQAMIREVERMFENKSVSAQSLAGGASVAELGDGFSNVYLARINPNGSVAGACVDNAAAAISFLNGASALEEK